MGGAVLGWAAGFWQGLGVSCHSVQYVQFQPGCAIHRCVCTAWAGQTWGSSLWQCLVGDLISPTCLARAWSSGCSQGRIARAASRGTSAWSIALCWLAWRGRLVRSIAWSIASPDSLISLNSVKRHLQQEGQDCCTLWVAVGGQVGWGDGCVESLWCLA